ncbi:Protein of unknown function [Gryllus bimaculatus]|nr:Protein of unknown function [Gryllus bimaculatus]
MRPSRDWGRGRGCQMQPTKLRTQVCGEDTERYAVSCSPRVMFRVYSRGFCVSFCVVLLG